MGAQNFFLIFSRAIKNEFDRLISRLTEHKENKRLMHSTPGCWPARAH